MGRRFVVAVALGVSSLAGCGGFGGKGLPSPVNGAAPSAAAAPSGPLGFTRDVLPILQTNCVPCHGPGGQMANAPLTTFTEVTTGATRLGNVPPSYVVAGSPAQSLIAVKTQAGGSMSVHLAPAQAQTISDWIAQGATDAPAPGATPAPGAAPAGADLGHP